MAVPSVVLALFAVALIASVTRVMSAAGGSVSRARVERFARRQQLRITAGNGNAVIRYLATTRRWRAAGLALGLMVSLVRSLPHGSATVDFFALFAGWFVGAVIAEWQINTAENGARQAALLVRRRRTDYLPGPARWLTDGSALATIALGATVVVRSAVAHDFDILSASLLAAAVAVIVIRIVHRQVLTRRQPVAETDVLAADDAIRARSLHVLAGSTLALLGYIASALVVQASASETASALSFGLLTVAPFFGWVIATGSSQVRRPMAHVAGSAVGVQP